MAFSKKTWKDRVSQYINRRLLTDSDGNTQQVTVTRDEGSVTEAGDAFSAANMNDLEDRIDNAFDGLTAADIPYSAGVSVADKLYVEGTSTVGDTVWSYRKWNSGVLEVWGKYSHAVSDSYHAWGSWFSYDVPSMGDYPIAFIALHSIVVNFGSNTNIGMIGVKANANPLTKAPEGLLVRPTQGGTETRIYGDLYAKGTWK